MTILSDGVWGNDLDTKGTHPLRAAAAVRRLLGAPMPDPAQFVAALLVTDAAEAQSGAMRTIALADLPQHVVELDRLGVKGIKLFTRAHNKGAGAEEASDPDSLSLRAIKVIKAAVPVMCVITDACLCTYTSSGDCVLRNEAGLQTDRTLALLAQHAFLQAEAGADIIGPAPMLPGAVAAIRKQLGERHASLPIMPHLTLRTSLHRTYRATMATGTGSQRQAFQIHPLQVDQYLEMAERLVQEGAAMLMMQPSLFSLDLIEAVRARAKVPVSIFSVSGEYEMFKSSPFGKELLLEHGIAAIRAGASFVVTYGAEEVAREIATLRSS